MRAKKRFGQHFLRNLDIARRISEALTFKIEGQKVNLLEIGGGTGVLTQFLLQRQEYELYVVEIDREAQSVLEQRFPQLQERIIKGDFLKLDLRQMFDSPLPVIGNIPYNLTGPIFFRILDYRDIVPQVVFMIQKEVAHRVVASPGSKEYGVLSVMLQTFYEPEYLFTVPASAFQPRPKVNSAVVRLNRKQNAPEIEDYDFYRYVVKTAFGQRRKTLRNSLGKLYDLSRVPEDFLSRRAEQLTVEDFVRLAQMVK